MKNPNYNAGAIKASVRIEDVIARYIHLDHKSGGKSIALCPFHSDHNPSFSVHHEKQYFNCFSCGEKGDVIRFIQLIENCTFGEALKKLSGDPGHPAGNTHPIGNTHIGYNDHIGNGHPDNNYPIDNVHLVGDDCTSINGNPGENGNIIGTGNSGYNVHPIGNTHIGYNNGHIGNGHPVGDDCTSFNGHPVGGCTSINDNPSTKGCPPSSSFSKVKVPMTAEQRRDMIGMNEKFLKSLYGYTPDTPGLGLPYVNFEVGMSGMYVPSHYKLMKSRIIFPIRDEDGILTGFSSRRTGTPADKNQNPTASSANKSTGYTADNSTGYTADKCSNGNIKEKIFNGNIEEKISDGGTANQNSTASTVQNSTASTVPSSSSPKYINSSTSELFDKSGMLYGLHLAKRAISNEGLAWVCEGYKDTIAMHASGYTNTVSLMGADLSDKQLALLKKYTNRVALLLDPDKAGRKGSAKAFAKLRAAGMEVRILELPEGEDPDSLFRRYGKEAFLAILRESHTTPKEAGINQSTPTHEGATNNESATNNEGISNNEGAINNKSASNNQGIINNEGPSNNEGAINNGAVLHDCTPNKLPVTGQTPSQHDAMDRPRLQSKEATLLSQINTLGNKLFTATSEEDHIQIHRELIICRKQLREISRQLNRPSSMLYY